MVPRDGYDTSGSLAACTCRGVSDRPKTNKNRDVPPFTNNSNSLKTAYEIDVPLIIQLPIELTKEPVTLGDHLRRHRIELGLYQKDVAALIGVTTSTIWNWENDWSSITLSCMPKVIEFLGYNPIPCPEDLMGRLAWYKQVNGLSLEQLGAEMGRDPEQLSDWLSGRHKPCRRNLEIIKSFFEGRHSCPCIAFSD